jgi:nucleoside-diphosphate-sugar epimerase
MKAAGPQVLVTGGLGWLGSRLINALCDGLPDDDRFKDAPPRSIRALDLPGQNTSPLQRLADRVEIVKGDLRDRRDCSRLCEGARGGILFHTAGIIHPRRVSDFNDVNVRGTENLLEAAIDVGVKRAVIISSNSPCGTNPHPDHLFDTLSPYHPYLGYGRSKMLMEQVVGRYFERGLIETVLLRAPWFYGPNQPPRQTLFFSMIRQGKAPVLGSGDNLRSMTYVDNLCQGMLLAATVPGANGRVFWISDRRPYSMNEILNTVEQLLEDEFKLTCRHRRMRLPRLAGTAAYAVDAALQAVGLYHQKIHVLGEMHRTIACSIQEAERDLGYRPAVELKEGMRRSIAWCLEKGLVI